MLGGMSGASHQDRGGGAVVIGAASLVPSKRRLRTGLPWQIEHMLAYFGATAPFCLAWPRRWTIPAGLMLASCLMEVMKGSRPTGCSTCRAR
jgi:hypothetical protein